MRRIFSAVLIFLAVPDMAFSEPTMAETVTLKRVSETPCSAPCNRVAVIFVHGITGDSNTWKNQASDWPLLLAKDPAIGSDLVVYRVDYYSRRNEGPSVPSLSKKLGMILDDELFRDGQYSKVIMVCHSLGGILCRGYLLHVKLRWGHAYLSLFRAVFTLGTPLEGSSLANFVTISRNEQFRVLRPKQKNDFLQLLENSTDEYLEKRGMMGCPDIQFYAGFETLPTPLREGFSFPSAILVTRQSATKRSQISMGFLKNHIELVKPADRNDAVYRWVQENIQTCQRGNCDRPIEIMCGRPPWLSQN